jgi:hypothetical protein
MSCDDESYGNMRYENSVTATLVLAREIPVSRSSTTTLEKRFHTPRGTAVGLIFRPGNASASTDSNRPASRRERCPSSAASHARFEMGKHGSAVATSLVIRTDSHSLDLASALAQHAQRAHGNYSRPSEAFVA